MGRSDRLALRAAALLADVTLALPVALAAMPMRIVRTIGLHRLPIVRSILRKARVLPVRAHYYDPFVLPQMLARPLAEERSLPGIALNIDGQLRLLEGLRYGEELTRFAIERRGGEFYYHNGYFESGDAEVLYSLIRQRRPRRLVEVGSGYSTLLARAAIQRNRADDAAYSCEHTCVEPYENPWLASSGATVVRLPVERVSRSLFDALEADDMLFIDSSHMIRPQGDVLVEVLEILPRLARGVLVHFHDIFTPRDYPERWVLDEARLWNEQYLVEAFLSCNREFRIVAALNLLAHTHREALAAAAPIYGMEASRREPGSLWIERI